MGNNHPEIKDIHNQQDIKNKIKTFNQIDQ